MSTPGVQLDFSKAQPLSLDFSKAQPLQQHAQAQAQPQNDLSANPHGEGTYRFLKPDGTVLHVPYSKALGLLGNPEQHVGIGPREMEYYQQGYEAAKSRGYTLHPDEFEHIYRDSRADPRAKERRFDNAMSTVPAVQTGIGVTRGAAKTVSGAAEITNKVAGRTNRTGVEKAVKNFAQKPNENAFQSLGETSEDVAEWVGGEALLKSIGKITKAAVTLGDAAKVEQEIQKGSTLGKLALHALQQGTVAGAQTYAKTAGDTHEALTAAGTAAGASAALEGTAGLLKKGISKLAPEATKTVEGVELGPEVKPQLTPAQEKGAEAYARNAQETIRPHLEAVNAASNGLPKVDVNTSLNRVGDYVRARSELAEGMNAVQEGMDKATKGRYSALRSQVSEAQQAAWKAGPGSAEEKAYQGKLSELDKLISNEGAGNGELASSLRAGWRQYYLLGDVTRVLDRSLSGLPGATKVSYAQRGIYGNQLLNGLSSMIRRNGRTAVEEALGGGERLQALEQIGMATRTNAGRASFNKAVSEVGKWIPRTVGAAAGWRMTGHWAGAAAGAAAGEVAADVMREKTARVMQAVVANPRIAQNLLFAIDSGARPEHYGPMIGAMIQQQFKQEAAETNPEDKQ